MILNLSPKTTLTEIQRLFRQELPFLKIMFLNKSHGWGQTIGKAHRYNSSLNLKALKCKAKNVTLCFHPGTKTGDVERIFEEELGLHVQIYRNEKDRSIETAGTDDFTLTEQNEIGWHQISQSGGQLPIERTALNNF
jgi:hypothetical protein